MAKQTGKSLSDFHKIKFHKKLYIIVLMLLGIGLPVAPFLVGFSQFFLVFIWLIEGEFQLKWQRFKADKALQFFLVIVLVHVIWLFNTSDFGYAFHDIKIKLPLLIIPLVVATSYVIDWNGLKQILLVFVGAVLVGTFISLAIYLGLTKVEVNDIRDISIFISHIRFGLMIVFSIFILAYYLYHSYRDFSLKKKILYLSAIAWLFFFLFILQSVTSWVIISLLTYIIITIYFKRIQWSFFKIVSWVYIIIVPILFFGLTSFVLLKFYSIDKVDFNNLPAKTKLGNMYTHNVRSNFTENGHYVWLYYSEKELLEYWPIYSDIPINGKDAKGQPLKFTLVRYLTSKNLTKDAEGLAKLTSIDIEMIKEGYASCVYQSRITPYVKLYELVWELNQYIKYGNPNAKTISMRIEFSKAGFDILKDNFWLGVGTGDVQKSFDVYYEKTNSPLKPIYRKRAHNQYLTFALTFGILGFILIIVAFVKPMQINKASWSALSMVFLVIILISMLNEDTLETQSGATICAYFYSLLILRRTNDD